MKHAPDNLDWKLMAALTGDGQASAGKLAEDLGVTGPTVRSRMRSLLREGVLRLSALVDPARVRGITVALVGVNLTAHSELGKAMDQIAALPNVHWAAVVTGRYDIILEVVLSEDIADLYRFMDEDLSGVGHIASSESFVVMKSRRKWLCLPRGARARLAGKA